MLLLFSWTLKFLVQYISNIGKREVIDVMNRFGIREVIDVMNRFGIRASY
jgi:hypothetical protein